MSYVALYRKYRPYNFSNVVGQDTIVKILVNSIKSNHISHAYLFTGPRGTGKTSLAKIFARAVNCLSFKEDLCDECTNCKALKENDIDIIEIDAASNNGVDEIRTLRDNVKLMPSFCKYKIYIIDEVHMLSTGAFNALLKTLEEPPSHVIFILATTEPNKIPLTILSRCQRFDFNRVSTEDLVSRMKYILKQEKKELDENVLNYIAESSDGCVRDTINLLDQVISLNKGKQTDIRDIDRLSGKISTDVIFDILNCILSEDYAKLLTISEELSTQGKNLSDVVNHLLTILRDIQIFKQLNNYFDGDYKQKLSQIQINSNDILIFSKSLNELLTEMKYTNNQKTLFEIYLMHLTEIVNEKKEKDIQKIDELRSESNLNNTFFVFNTDNENNLNDNLELNNNEQGNLAFEKTIQDDDVQTSMFNENNKSDINELRQIRINNVFAGANKDELKRVQEGFDRINDYISNKKYNALVQVLDDTSIVVASSDLLMIKVNDSGALSIFNNNIKQIEIFLNEIYKREYRIVAVTSDEWTKLKEEYIFKKKNNIPYVIIDENSVKLEVSKGSQDIEDAATDIFGQNVVNIK